MPEAALQTYRNRVETFDGRDGPFGVRIAFLTTGIRFGTFCCAAWMLLAWFRTLSPLIFVMLMGISAALLAVAHIQRSRCRAERQRYRDLRSINEEAIARIQRDWGHIPLTDVCLTDTEQVTAADLNLFGNASVFHLICHSRTQSGFRTLKNWLLTRAVPDEIKQRQIAVDELSPQLVLRHDIRTRCRLLTRTPFVPDEFLNWAEGDPYLANTFWLKWLSRILPAISVTMLTLVLVGVLPQGIGLPIVMAAIAANIMTTVIFAGSVHDIFETVCPEPDGFRLKKLQEVFATLSTLDGDSPMIKEIRQTSSEASRQLHQLRRIMQPASLSRSPITAVLIYLPLQFMLLWDFHILYVLERWQARSGGSFRQWLDALGRFEALESLASVAHDNPDWTFPSVGNDGECEFCSQQMGHPLLPAATRVANDVRLGPAGRLMLVTGSNMSGKSTLLRAIGANAVLAQAGSKVCATQLSMPSVSIVTSMRITDDLNDGVSLFMAELQRLKEIVEAARAMDQQPHQTMLCLLDEILHGTNSSERHIAVKRVLSHLLRHRVIGAVTTHDLQLADDATINGNCDVVHFRESFDSRDDDIQMSFDYIMRPGVASTTNALKLLKIVGL